MRLNVKVEYGRQPSAAAADLCPVPNDRDIG
jgi:hypothetical protein